MWKITAFDWGLSHEVYTLLVIVSFTVLSNFVHARSAGWKWRVNPSSKPAQFIKLQMTYMSFSVLHYLALASKLGPLWLGFVRCGVIQLTWTLRHGTSRFKFSACCLHGWWSRHCVSYWNRATILVWWALSPGSLCVWTYSNIASELEDVLKLPSNEFQTLVLLDAALRRFLSLCSAYHGTCIPPDTIRRNWSAYSEQYLQTPLQLEHAFQMLLDSELFEFHSERMCEIIMDDSQAVSPPTIMAFSVALHLYSIPSIYWWTSSI